MKAGINHVMIKAGRTREELISGIYKNRDGLLYISDASHNKAGQTGAHKCQHGEIVDVGVLYPDKMERETTNELQKGDTVVYYFNDDAWNNGRFHIEGETVYFFIRYDNIYFVIRDGKIIPVNGYVLVEPLKSADLNREKYNVVGDEVPIMGSNFLSGEKDDKLWILDEGFSKTYGHVRHIGKPLIRTKITDRLKTEIDDEVPRFNGTVHAGYGVKEGDLVFFHSWCAKPIMYNAQNFIGELYAMRRFGMWCVIEDPSKVTLKENSKHVKHENMEMSGEDIEQAQREWSRVQGERKDKPRTTYY